MIEKNSELNWHSLSIKTPTTKVVKLSVNEVTDS